MKTLNLHVDYIKFKPLKKALKGIEALPEKDKAEKEVKNALAVFTAVEKSDTDIKGIVKQLVEGIQEIAKQVNVQNIVLYPYAHLSNDLALPEDAIMVLDEAEKQLKKLFKVFRAPFGYYKELEMKIKGHPLSELSREIRVDIDGEENKKKGGSKEEEKYDAKQLLKEIGKNILDRSKLKPNDHRIIGMEMDLYSFNEVAPGMVFWHNNGLIIRNELINFWREMHRKSGYQEISTPQIMDKKLWQISGHWEKYKENNFITAYEGKPFLIKPMNCPGGMLVYKNKPKSYKELPLRVGELGVVHRQELSGVLGGLFRAVQFTQDDAHIFCTEEQLESEIIAIMELIDIFYKKFNLPFDHVELSTRPEKRIGDDKIWDKAEKVLENVLKKTKMKYKINKGEGAFYGPKIDFHFCLFQNIF
jgi:threonyl-tRNA synthetase